MSVDNADSCSDEQHDSYSVICIMIEDRVTASLRRYEDMTTKTGTQITIKPSPTAAERDCATLSADNYSSLIWRQLVSTLSCSIKVGHAIRSDQSV